MGLLFIILFLRGIVSLAAVIGRLIHKRDLRKGMQNLCAGLGSIGLEAKLVGGRRPEQSATGNLVGKSSGLIEIMNSLIRRVNVLEADKGGPLLPMGVVSTTYRYSNVCLVAM